MALLLSGCAGLPQFPTKYIYEFDPKTPVCAQYEITNYETLTYKWVMDIPFAQCPALFGFTSTDVPKVLDWGRNAISYSKAHCK